MNQLSLATPTERTAPITAPVPYNPLGAELALYRLLRSNSIWFATRNDGYSYRTHSGGIDVKDGVCKKHSLAYYQQSVDLWTRLYAHDAADFPIGMASNLFASADLPHDTNCLCPVCTREAIKPD